jgi:Tfp pilus assembly protein PilV
MGRPRRRDDEGFGLVEVVVSMMILMILFFALLTVLIRALEVTAANGTKATAAQLATERIELARQTAVTGDCSNVRLVVEAVDSTVDGRGIPLTVTGTVGNCTQTAGSEHDQPRLARVSVTVTTTANGYSNPIVATASDVYVRFDPGVGP